MKKEKNEKEYLKESAGKLMVVNVPTVSQEATVEDIERLLLENSKNFETINYIYLVDKNKTLKGVVSIKEIFRSLKKELAKKLSPDKIITIRAHTDQERAAFLALKYNLKEVPVVDKQGKFLGAITSDVILNILHSENIEDALLAVGTGRIKDPVVSIIKGGVWLHFRKRLPWLILGLLGGMVAAFVVRFFESALEEKIILAAFIPTIVYMADAVGSQTQAILIRSLTVEHSLDFGKYIWRETKIIILLSVLLGGLISFVLFIWKGDARLSFVLGLSMIATILSAMVVSIFLPWFFKKIKSDPAIASGPFATVISDITSLLIYFSIANLFF